MKNNKGGNKICIFFIFIFVLFVCVNGRRGRDAPEKPLENNDLYTWWCTGNCGQIPQVVNPTYGLVLMGGGTDVDSAYIWMIEKMGGGDFVVLRTSGDGDYNPYIYDLGLQTSTPLNSVSTLLLKSRNASFDTFVVGLVGNCSGVYFAGGDQWVYYSYWKGSPLHQAILKSPIYPIRPIGGTSAGCAIQPSNSYTAQYGSAGSVESLINPYNKYISFGSNFLENPILQNTITDTHFEARDRMGRLVAFLSRSATDILSPLAETGTGCGLGYGARALGIDEATAVLIDENGIGSITSWDVDGSAYLLCLDTLPDVCEPETPLEVSNIQTVKMSGNITNVFNFNTWTPLDAQNVVQYTLSAADNRLSSEGNGGKIY